VTEENDSYWILEWRYPAGLGKPASSWMPCDMIPSRYKDAAERLQQRPYYDYRMSEFTRIKDGNPEITLTEICRRQLENILYCCKQEPPVLVDSIAVYAETALKAIQDTGTRKD